MNKLDKDINALKKRSGRHIRNVTQHDLDDVLQAYNALSNLVTGTVWLNFIMEAGLIDRDELTDMTYKLFVVLSAVHVELRRPKQ